MRALVIGSISLDVDWRGRDARPGGVVLHAGLVYRSLGARVRVVTSVRPVDAPALLAPLRAARVAVRARPSRRTTQCANDYGGAIDRHALRRRSDPIRLRDVPPGWRRAEVVHVGPLHPSDVALEVMAGVRGLLGLDVQGLLRGRPVPALADYVAHATVVQVSAVDAPRLLAGDTLERFRRRFGIPELVLTRGSRGAVVVTAHRRRVVPAHPAGGRHLVGAGDAFLAAYLFARARGAGPTAAARRAALVAARKITLGTLPLPRVGRARVTGGRSRRG